MCGIVGYSGSRAAAPILLEALRDLEYRGYDSAGIAVLNPAAGEEAFTITKREGKIANLAGALTAAGDAGATTGIGHTRWATHGRPSDRNAHPHPSCRGEVVVVHNGIVENYAALRAELLDRGHRFDSETDTETIAHLLEEETAAGAELLEGLRRVCGRLEGSQAIVAMSASEPGVLAAARLGNAGGIVVGYCDDGTVLASDLAAVLPHTRRVSFLADRTLTEIRAEGARFIDATGAPLAPEIRTVDLDPVGALKGGYAHFMLKEIMEQPQALRDTIQGMLTLEPPRLRLDTLAPAVHRFTAVRRVVLIGMGTSLHAAMVGRHYVESVAGIPAECDNASEFRYRSPVLDEHTLVVSVSQSGETVDVLEAMAVARAAGALLVTICNTEGSQTTRVAHGTVYTHAGLERGVASTKCFTTAIVALYGLALALAQANGRLSEADLARHARELSHLPDAAGTVLAAFETFKQAARLLDGARGMLFLGRALALPVALEGALKMKEISYIHAEGYPAGEMKHGPIALIEPSFPTVAIATRHALRTKLISNIEQVQARGGPVIAVCTEGDEDIPRLVSHVITVPEVSPALEPVIATIPLQCLAYFAATSRGCDVDQPRNLAKTVTVE